MFKSDQDLLQKWAPVLDHESAPKIDSHEKRTVTARLLENTEEALRQEAAAQSFTLSEAAPGTGVGSIENPDPVLISLIRRAMPNLIAYDVCGVQPMSGPTGLIFAMKARYEDDSSAGITTADSEALFNEADTDFAGAGTHTAGGSVSEGVAMSTLTGSNALASGTVVQIMSAAGNTTAGNFNTMFGTGANTVLTPGQVVTANGGNGNGDCKVLVLGRTGTGTATATAEADTTLPDMGFTVEKVSVTAKTRQLQAQYTMELAQDLKAVHGLDAEAELANILSAEILAEINREVIRNINFTAKTGTTGAVDGNINLGTAADVGDGRWQAEKFQALGFRLEQEANIIAKETRRGKGNYIIASSSVAAALSASGALAYGSAITAGDLAVDNAGNTFAGTLKNGMKVYVDPYATFDYATVGYKGSNTFDAGLFYCPYVPLTMMKAVTDANFQPKVGFKTRYGIVANPFADEAGAITEDLGIVGNASNPYFRRNVVIGV